jgi:hypothetical protein
LPARRRRYDAQPLECRGVIVYKKTPHLRLTRAQVPEPPYWAASTIAPYSPRRAAPIAIDYIDLRASCAERFEVSVCENVRDDLERGTTRHPLHAPALIDAAEFAEVIFGRGEEALQFCAEQHVAAMQIVSTRGALPKNVPDNAVITIAAWPLELDRLGALFAWSFPSSFRSRPTSPRSRSWRNWPGRTSPHSSPASRSNWMRPRATHWRNR